MKLKNKSKPNKPPLEAEKVPSRIRFTCEDGSIRLEAAAEAEEGKGKLRRFSMTAYTGGAMVLAGWQYPVVVDLGGLRVPRKSRPILKDHNHSQIVGHTDEIAVGDQSLNVTGVISGAGAVAQEVIATSDNGFPWQASLGASADKVVFIAEGKTAQANGRNFTGPLYIARKSTLGEISFVALGADDDTSARVAAGADKDKNLEVTTMEFEQWADDCGFSIDEMDEKNVASLKAVFDKERQLIAAEAKKSNETPVATIVDDDPPPNPASEMRSQAAAEVRRIAAIRKVCAGEYVDIEAQAIEEGWDVTKTELAVLRAGRPKAPAIHTEDSTRHSGPNLEAALCMSAGISEETVAAWYDEPTMEAARKPELRGTGIHTLLYEVIRAAGGHVRPGRVDNDTIQAAFWANNHLIQAASGFSTLSLAGILGNIANKSMLAAYRAVNTTSQAFCATTDVNDFKQVTRYRMTASGIFQKVGPDGELKHATLEEESYTNQVDTYGRIIALTRQMIINDDLGAFLQIPRAIGRMSALALEEAVFTLLLANPNSFFSAQNSNYFDGADSALDIDSLTVGEQKFLDRTDSQGKPILITPAILMVPTSLKVTAEQLFKETQINQVPANNKPKTAANPHAGKFRPVASPYLSLPAIPGSSTTAWYLFSEPSDVAVIEIAYLRGRRSPVIESGETDFNTLGMQWRGYFDFGVSPQETRAGVKSKGAA